jgi:hypothetical protein
MRRKTTETIFVTKVSIKIFFYLLPLFGFPTPSNRLPLSCRFYICTKCPGRLLPYAQQQIRQIPTEQQSKNSYA